MKKILLILFFVISANCVAQLKTEFLEKGNKIRIYLANTITGQGIDTTILNANKIKPALHYITLLNDKYEVAPDSLVNAAIKKLDNPTAFDIANEVLADKIFIVKLEQLINVIRVEIISANPMFPKKAQTAEGVAILKLFKKSDGMPYFDPTILMAMQRAFAAIENDNLMFMKNDEPYNIKPAQSTAILGIEFINDDNFVNWDLFNNPLLNSFEFIELIFESIYKNTNWVIFDTDTRDAIYGLNNLFLIENNIAPSYDELAILRQFNIEYYITGKIERTVNGITITLFIKENKLTSNNVIKSVSRNVYENNMDAIKNVIRELAKELVAD